MLEDPFEGDDAFADLVVFALEQGVEAVRGGEDPLVPFVLVRLPGEEGPKLTRVFGGDDYARDVERARELATADARATVWVVAWDGYVTLDDVRTDAVFAAGLGGEGTRVVTFAWRYRRDVAGALETIGDPLWVAVEDVT